MILPIELCNCTSDHGKEVSTSQQPHCSVISYHVSTSLFTHCPDFWYYRISLIAFESYTWNPVFILVVQSCLIFATSLTSACQAPVSMEYSRQEYWSGLPFSTLGHGIIQVVPVSSVPYDILQFLQIFAFVWSL